MENIPAYSASTLYASELVADTSEMDTNLGSKAHAHDLEKRTSPVDQTPQVHSAGLPWDSQSGNSWHLCATAAMLRSITLDCGGWHLLPHDIWREGPAYQIDI